MRSEHAVAAGAERVTAAPITGVRRGALLGFRWALLGFLLAGVAQIFLAGLGVFGLQDQGLAAAGDRPSRRTARSGSRWARSHW
jgi:hypothetical protein